MIRIRLSPPARELLEHTFRTTADRRLRERCQAVLMAARGRPRQQIAEDLGVHRASVHRWLRAYEQSGLNRLVIQWAPGQPGRIPEALAPVIVEWVKGGPEGCGLNRANWTYAELAHHLYQTHGITVGETAMRTFCHRHGIRPYRPTYQYLRGDPVRQATAREELAALKKRPKRASASGFARTRRGFRWYPPCAPPSASKATARSWGPGITKTSSIRLPLWTSSVVGSRRAWSVSPAWAQAKTAKSKTRRLQEAFAAHLRDSARAYPIEQFKRVIITIDNAPWHRGRLITEVLAEHPQLELYRLPSYSPKLNVIERLWKVLRRRATHNRLFETLTELKAALRASLCYFQTLRHKVLSLIEDPKKVARLAAS